MEFKINKQRFPSVGVRDEEAYVATASASLWDYEDSPAPERKRKAEAHEPTMTQRMVKRGFDILVAVVAFAVFAPVIAIIALTVWLEGPAQPYLPSAPGGSERQGVHHLQVPHHADRLGERRRAEAVREA